MEYFNICVTLIVIWTSFWITSATGTGCNTTCKTPSRWIPQAQNVCYGPKGRDYGTFQIKQNCKLFALRLQHISGSIRCGSGGTRSTYWGCRGIKQFSTVIIDAAEGNKKFLPEKFSRYGTYKLTGFTNMDDVIFMKKRADLSAGKVFQIWYGTDFQNRRQDSEGRHCVNVDISCMV